jgi:hypothetical protein
VVSTHENELTDDVDLCLPDGSRLNPAARGWVDQASGSTGGSLVVTLGSDDIELPD